MLHKAEGKLRKGWSSLTVLNLANPIRYPLSVTIVSPLSVEPHINHNTTYPPLTYLTIHHVKMFEYVQNVGQDVIYILRTVIMSTSLGEGKHLIQNRLEIG